MIYTNPFLIMAHMSLKHSSLKNIYYSYDFFIKVLTLLLHVYLELSKKIVHKCILFNDLTEGVSTKQLQTYDSQQVFSFKKKKGFQRIQLKLHKEIHKL